MDGVSLVPVSSSSSCVLLSTPSPQSSVGCDSTKSSSSTSPSTGGANSSSPFQHIHLPHDWAAVTLPLPELTQTERSGGEVVDGNTATGGRKRVADLIARFNMSQPTPTTTTARAPEKIIRKDYSRPNAGVVDPQKELLTKTNLNDPLSGLDSVRRKLSGNGMMSPTKTALPSKYPPTSSSVSTATFRTPNTSTTNTTNTANIQRHPSTASIASTDSATPNSHSASGSLFSPGTKILNSKPLHSILTSPESVNSTSSQQSGYDASPESGLNSPPSPSWNQHFKQRSNSSSSSKTNSSSNLYSSSTSTTLSNNTPSHSASITPNQTRLIRPVPQPLNTGDSSPESAHIIAPTNSFGLTSPPLHRSASPEHMFTSPSVREKTRSSRHTPIVVAGGSGSSSAKSTSSHRDSALTSRLDETRHGSDLIKASRLIQQQRAQERADSTSPERQSSPIIPKASPPPSNIARPSLLKLESTESNSPPTSAQRPPSTIRSPPMTGGSSHGSPSPKPNFMKGNFLGSPLAYSGEFSRGHATPPESPYHALNRSGTSEDLDESGGETIQIIEKIPYLGSPKGSHSSAFFNSPAHQEREEEERTSIASFKPKLKLRLARSSIGSESSMEDPNESIATTNTNSNDISVANSMDHDAYVLGTSPKNANKFGLKLGGLTDSVNSSIAPSVANSMNFSVQMSTSKLPTNAPSLQASMSDSLTASGRVALANFYASHAAAMNSNKRAPGGRSSNSNANSVTRSKSGGKHRVSESYDVSQHGTLILDGFEIGSTGIQRTPHVQDWTEEDDLENTRRSMTGLRLNGSGEDEESHDTFDINARGGQQGRYRSESDDAPPAPLPLSQGGRRPSAVAQRLLTPAPGTPGGPMTPGGEGRFASLGVELRLSEMVRIGDLGVGQNGTVVKALYLPPLQIVALKVCTVFDKDERHQMLKELRAFNSCNSDHIVSFIGACFMEGRITMALEFMNRGSLDQVVKKQGPLSISMIRNISKQVLKGLKHMHSRKCIHRDIKPANVLIDNDGNCKISDFGLLKQLDGTNQMASTFVGTMVYLSPERIIGESFSYSSDIWSWGISVIFLATGELNVPKDYWSLLNYIKGPNPITGLDRKKFPADLCDFVDACLTKDPADRPSAATLLKHPFILAKDPPGTPLQQIWPFSTGKEPDRKELDLLVQAVIDHYYYTPAEIASGVHLNSSSSSTPKTIFTMGPTDQQRLQHLAQQMAWNLKPLQEAFIRRLVVQGKSIGGVQGEATTKQEEEDEDETDVGASASFSAGNKSSTSAAPSSVAAPLSASVTSSQHRLKLTRQKSVTLDQDPLFAGVDFTKSFNMKDSLTRSRVASSLAGQSMERPSTLQPPSTSSPSTVRRSTSNSNILHTSSPQRRLDDSSTDEEMLSPERSFDRRSSGGHSTSSRLSFDPNAKIRSLREPMTNATAAVNLTPTSAAGSTSSSQPRKSLPKPNVNASFSLGSQLEKLHEEDDD